MSKLSPKPVPTIVPPPADVDAWIRKASPAPEPAAVPEPVLVERRRRCTIDVPASTYRRLKVLAATTDRRMQDILAEAIDGWLASR